MEAFKRLGLKLVSCAVHCSVPGSDLKILSRRAKSGPTPSRCYRRFDVFEKREKKSEAKSSQFGPEDQT